jgi:hypothetical protein
MVASLPEKTDCIDALGDDGAEHLDRGGFLEERLVTATGSAGSKLGDGDIGVDEERLGEPS